MKEIQETIKEIYMEAQEGKVVDVNAKLSSFSTNHMTQLLFGKRYCGVGTDQKEAQWFKRNTCRNFALGWPLLVGGIGSIAGTLEWVLAELLLHPNIMKHAQTELDNLVGTNRLVEESDLQHLPYLQAILKETLRLHPVGPFLFPHHSIEPCQVQGYTIPAKTRVLVNIWALGRDPNSWENPLEFDPDRFMQHPEIDVARSRFQFVGHLGVVDEGCPGRPLAMVGCFKSC
ncbi:hypothetical protein CY35_06G108100 [Sphagnum magellanicum]|nr:hypothetical protein CY35_06G108100 [Sphagnum magellanicum]